MKTTIDIDDRLLAEAMRLSGIRTKKATVEAALRLLIQMDAQEDIRRLRGQVRWGGINGEDTTPSRAVKRRYRARR